MISAGRFMHMWQDNRRTSWQSLGGSLHPWTYLGCLCSLHGLRVVNANDICLMVFAIKAIDLFLRSSSGQLHVCPQTGAITSIAGRSSRSWICDHKRTQLRSSTTRPYADQIGLPHLWLSILIPLALILGCLACIIAPSSLSARRWRRNSPGVRPIVIYFSSHKPSLPGW